MKGTLDREFLRAEFNAREEQVLRAADNGYLDDSFKQILIYVLIDIGRAILSTNKTEQEIVQLHPIKKA